MLWGYESAVLRASKICDRFSVSQMGAVSSKFAPWVDSVATILKVHCGQTKQPMGGARCWA